MKHKGSKWQDFLNERLESNAEFKELWEEDEHLWVIIKLMLKLRAKYNLSQKDLAIKLGTTQSYISRIENGNTEIGSKFLFNLVKAFNGEIKFEFPEPPQKLATEEKKVVETSQ